MFRNQPMWIEAYEKKNALWIHDSNPKHPHAELASGNHSNGFFNSRLIIEDEVLMHQAASDLIELFIANGGDITYVSRTVGPQTGATKLAEYLSDEISKRRNTPCGWASPAKHGEGKDKTMVFDDPARTVELNEDVLCCEDVLTTGGSVELTAAAVYEKGGIIMPYVLMLVNRSGLTEVNNMRIIALITKHMPIWKPEECPLCKQVSKAIRPKDNWAALNAAS